MTGLNTRVAVVAAGLAALLLGGCGETTQPTVSPTVLPTVDPTPVTTEPSQKPTEPVETGSPGPVETASPEPAETTAAAPELDPDNMVPFPAQVGEYVHEGLDPLGGYYVLPDDPDSPTVQTEFDPNGAMGEWEGYREDEWNDGVWYCGSASNLRFCDTQITPGRGALVLFGRDEDAMLALADELLAVWPYEGFR